MEIYPKGKMNYKVPKRYYVYGPHDCYRNYYKKENPDSKITTHQYYKVVQLFFSEVLKWMVDTRLSFYMPNGLGRWYILMKKRKTPYLNLHDTIKYGKPIYVLNLHLDGKYPTLKWEEHDSNRYKNKAYTSLQIHKRCKNFVKKLFKPT